MKEYTGTAYIGVVGPELDYAICRDSIEMLSLRHGDSAPVFARGTKGYESRQTHLNKFIESKHDFLLLLDADMVFAADTLERLRSHRLPYVSGLYMRRDYNPIAPIWYKPFTGQWPIEPWFAAIEKGKLHKIGASGWGCILVHREVVLAVRALLYGEWEVLEDDMDIWPYDLTQVMGAINGLRALVDGKPVMSTLMPALEAHTATLQRQIRPLRADRDQIGSDLRFPFFALQAGYQLMGDPDVRPSHMLNYPLNPNDYDLVPEQNKRALVADMRKHINADRKRLAQQGAL